MCKLIDLLLLCNEEMTIKVFSNDCELIAQHNGKDSIEPELNHRYIEWIYPVTDNTLNIGIA